MDTRMTWSVLLSLSVNSEMALQPQSGFAELEAGRTLEDYCCGRGRSRSVVLIMGCKPFCSLLLFQWCTCYAYECMPVGADLGRYAELGRLDATPFQAVLQCGLVTLLWLALFSLFLMLVHQRTAALVCAHHTSG